MTERRVKAYELWKNNFHNAKKFFDSKGNTQTKSRLKTKWYDKFYDDLNKLGPALIAETTGSIEGGRK